MEKDDELEEMLSRTLKVGFEEFSTVNLKIAVDNMSSSVTTPYTPVVQNEDKAAELIMSKCQTLLTSWL